MTENKLSILGRAPRHGALRLTHALKWILWRGAGESPGHGTVGWKQKPEVGQNLAHDAGFLQRRRARVRESSGSGSGPRRRGRSGGPAHDAWDRTADAPSGRRRGGGRPPRRARPSGRSSPSACAWRTWVRSWDRRQRPRGPIPPRSGPPIHCRSRPRSRSAPGADRRARPRSARARCGSAARSARPPQPGYRSGFRCCPNSQLGQYLAFLLGDINATMVHGCGSVCHDVEREGSRFTLSCASGLRLRFGGSGARPRQRAASPRHQARGRGWVARGPGDTPGCKWSAVPRSRRRPVPLAQGSRSR